MFNFKNFLKTTVIIFHICW